jgi:multidrug transporter EmrE-like cation transporter
MPLSAWYVPLMATEAVALYGTQHAVTTPEMSSRMTMVAVIAYAAIPLLLMRIVKNNGVGKVNCTWNILSMMYGMAIGTHLFGEECSVMAKVGMLLGVVSVFLMNN